MEDFDLADAGLSQQDLLDTLANSAPDYTGIKEMFLRSMAGDSITYIVTGDSTRNNNFNGMIAYYNKQLPKVGIPAIYENATSGLKAEAWLDNTGNATINEAIAATSGTGSSTILEFSLGVNDSTLTDLEFKDTIRDCVQTYLASKPDATVLLVSPVTTLTQTARRETAYTELSVELGLLLVSGVVATTDVYGDADYYHDATHPSKWGSMRLFNYIFTNILPLSGLQFMTMENVSLGQEPDPNLPAVVESGLWSGVDGAPIVNADWRRLEAIAVEPNFTLHVTDQGNQNKMVFMDDQGAFISRLSMTDIGNNTQSILVPVNAFEARYNITDDGATWDALSDVPTVVYAPSTGASYMPQLMVNDGLNIAMAIVSEPFIDANGFLPQAGQVMTGQADGSALWV